MSTDPTGHATPAPDLMAALEGVFKALSADYERERRELPQKLLAERNALIADAAKLVRQLEQARVDNARLRERAAAATEARQQLAGDVERIAAEMDEAGWSPHPYWTRGAKLRAALAATAPPAAPGEPPANGTWEVTESEMVAWTERTSAKLGQLDYPTAYVVSSTALSEPPPADQGMVREAGRGELLMACPTCRTHHLVPAGDLDGISLASRTDEHLQALRAERDEALKDVETLKAHESKRLANGLRDRGWVAEGDTVRSALRLIDAKEALIEAIAGDRDKAQADLAEARQEAERLRGEVGKLAGEAHAHAITSSAPVRHVYAEFARWLRALASTGGSDTTTSTGGSDHD